MWQKNPYIETFIFFSKISISCLMVELFFEKYLDLNKISPLFSPFLHWFANFAMYYPYSYLMMALKNSDYLENFKSKHLKIFKERPNFDLKGIAYAELIFLIVCHVYDVLFLSNSRSNGNIFQKLGWFYLCIIICDVWFFAIHYILHEKFYWAHKKHHLEVNINGFSSEIKSFYESLIFTLSDIIVFVLLGRDMNQFISWIVIGVLYNVEGHSTLKLFYIREDFHLNHHLYIDCNYGIGFYLDHFFGTTYKGKRVQH